MVQDHKIQQNETIFDIANITLGGFDNIYLGLISLNLLIPNINTNLNTIATQTIQFDDLYYQSETLQVQLNVVAPSNLKAVKGLENQSIYDLVLMNYGSLDSVFDFIQSNNLVSINELNMAYKNVIFDSTKIINENITKSVASKNYTFATLVFADSDGVVWDGVYDIWDGIFDLGY